MSGEAGDGAGVHVGHGGHRFLDLLKANGSGEEENLLRTLHVPLLHGGYQEVLLLSTLTTATPGQFVAACFVIALISAVVEFLRFGSSRMERQMDPKKDSPVERCRTEPNVWISNTMKNAAQSFSKVLRNVDTEYETMQNAEQPKFSSVPEREHQHTRYEKVRLLLCIGVLHVLTYLLATLLMLLAMTFNVYVILALAFGSGIGRLLTLQLSKRFEGSDL